MGTGFIIGGIKYRVPGVDVMNWQDDPRLVPRGNKCTPIHRKRTINGCVLHLSDAAKCAVLPGTGSGDKGEALVRYQVDSKREASWEATGSPDARVFWQNDPIEGFTWHAMKANAHTIGWMAAQVVTKADAPNKDERVSYWFDPPFFANEPLAPQEGFQYQRQLDAQVACLNVLSRALEFPRQVPIKRVNGVVEPDLGFIDRDPDGMYGAYGFCNITKNRGPETPGPHIINALLSAGWMGFDYRAGEDIAFWKSVQKALGMNEIDGFPGRETRAALIRAGYPNAQLISMPQDRIPAIDDLVAEHLVRNTLPR